MSSDVIDDTAASGSYETFFTESSSGKYVPRAIFIDLDPSVCACKSLEPHLRVELIQDDSPSMRFALGHTVNCFTRSS
jgi:hypothetical protein